MPGHAARVRGPHNGDGLMPVPTEMYENIDHMVGLLHEQIETCSKLTRAFRLADLLGIPPKELTGKISTRVIDDDRMFRLWKGAIFVVKYDGVEHRFPLKEVHVDLWPADMRVQYEREVAKQARQRQDIGVT